MLLSCALLGGFAIGTRVWLLSQHSPNANCKRVLVLALFLVIIVVIVVVVTEEFLHSEP